MTPIDRLIEFVKEMNSKQTDGEWLEAATQDASTLIRDWDIAACWTWADWPERELYFPNSTGKDIGIDLVARRASYAEYVAIQCKARQLDSRGEGKPITKRELDSFASVSSADVFAERWVVTNGNVAFGHNADGAFLTGDRPLKLFNLAHELQLQSAAERAEQLAEEECEHCATESTAAPPPNFGRRTGFGAVAASTNEIVHATRSRSRKCSYSAGARRFRQRRIAEGTGPRQDRTALRYG